MNLLPGAKRCCKQFAFQKIYSPRAEYPEYNRITFVLLGKATPSSLVTDDRKTPFNIGQAINLSGFKLHEVVYALADGLKDHCDSPQTVLKEILVWTGGQPFLTQKVCFLTCQSDRYIPAGKEPELIEQLVKREIISDWEHKDSPEHLRVIRRYLLSKQFAPGRLLEIYREILEKGEIPVVDSPEYKELYLSGIVRLNQDKIEVGNRIYETIFNQNWLEQQLVQIGKV